MSRKIKKILDFINRKNVILFVGAAFSVLFLLITVFAPLLEVHDPLQMDMSKQFIAPCFEYPFVTDNLGL